MSIIRQKQKRLRLHRLRIFSVLLIIGILIAVFILSHSAITLETPEPVKIPTYSGKVLAEFELEKQKPEYELVSLGIFTLTAYCPCVLCTEIWSAEHPSRIGTDFVQKTASGTIPKQGRTIAVDTSVIDFGTIVVINGYEFIAEDRGGAIRGKRIDVFFECHQEALVFGRRMAEVFIKIFN